MDIEGSVNVLSATTQRATLALNGDRGDIAVGGNGQTGTVEIAQTGGQVQMSLEAVLNGGRLRITDSDRRIAVELAAALNVALLALGGAGFDGALTLKNDSGRTAIQLSGRDGDIILNDDEGKPSVTLSGPEGDVRFLGADAAEEFECVEECGAVAAGTVMVIDHTGKLRESVDAYDRRVAGVVSGGGDLKPGIILGHTRRAGCRRSIAVVGQVRCKADASMAPIEVGDLLTSSSTPGHAMKADDPTRAFGSIIGKALESVATGKALIPILVALQ
jgi:hypothetical protein